MAQEMQPFLVNEEASQVSILNSPLPLNKLNSEFCFTVVERVSVIYQEYYIYLKMNSRPNLFMSKDKRVSVLCILSLMICVL